METWTARIEIDRATFSTKKGGRPGRKKLVKKGKIGMNLHAGRDWQSKTGLSEIYTGQTALATIQEGSSGEHGQWTLVDT
jgi:hypothetical protein